MSTFQYVFRNAMGNKIIHELGEAQVRIIIAATSKNEDESIRVLKETPGGQLACTGGYIRYVR